MKSGPINGMSLRVIAGWSLPPRFMVIMVRNAHPQIYATHFCYAKAAGVTGFPPYTPADLSFSES